MRFKQLLPYFFFLVFCAATAVVGTHWKQEGSVLFPADDITEVNFSTVTLAGDTVGDGTFASLSEEDEDLGPEYILGATFSTVTTFQSSKSSALITDSLITNDLTLLAGAGGEYLATLDMSVIAHSGTEITFSVFLNATTSLSSIIRPIVGGHFHAPTFINISVGTFGANSSISHLIHEDGDSVIINEINGNTPGYLVDFIFNGDVLAPHHVEFAVLYDGAPTHNVECQMWNYVLFQFDECRDDIQDIEDGAGDDAFRYIMREFEFPNEDDYVDTVEREAKVRIIHTSTGGPGDTLNVDSVELHDQHNAAAVALISLLTLRGGDVITVKMKSNKEDTKVWLQNMHLELVRISR